MSIWVTSVSLIIIVSLFAKFLFEKKNQRLYRLLEQFPSHSTYPLIGNLHAVWNPTTSLLEKIDKVLQPYDRQVFWYGPLPALLLKKHDDIAAILSQCYDRETMGLADLWFGTGVITGRYADWKKSRKILKPAFSSQMISKYLQVLNKNASRYVENLKPVADTGEEVDVLCRMMQVKLESMIENALGTSIESRGKIEQDFCQAMLEAFTSIFQRACFPILIPNGVYKLYLKLTRKTRVVEHLKFYPAEVLKQKLYECQDFQEQNSAEDNDNESKSRRIVDLLIKTRLRDPNFTESRMRDELLQVIGAGIEPTGLTLSFLMLMLAINQDVQQKVYEEITQLTTSKESVDGTLTEDDLNNRLKYLEQCIKETLRLFSPVAHDLRRTHKEILLGDKIIPANIPVAIFIYAANRDGELYKNPFKWDPEHFSEEAVQQRPETSFLSFGYGGKYCLGVKYAMASIKLAIVAILRKYYLTTHLKELTHKDLYIDLTIKSKHGYPIRFTSRSETRA